LEAVRRPGAKAVCAARGRQVERNGHHQRAEAKGGKGRQRGLHFKTGFSRLDVCPIRALLFIENPYNAIEGAFPLLFPVLARENSSKERRRRLQSFRPRPPCQTRSGSGYFYCLL
jgi:hypothetical protein